jgi:hypothetical protein
MVSAVYRVFEQAMLERKQISCTYDGGYRELCAYILGHKHAGEEVSLAYQFGGLNSRGLPVRGEWKCLYLTKISNAQTHNGEWYGGESSHKQRQHCVEVFDIDVNPSSPYSPRRPTRSRA